VEGDGDRGQYVAPLPDFLSEVIRHAVIGLETRNMIDVGELTQYEADARVRRHFRAGRAEKPEVMPEIAEVARAIRRQIVDNFDPGGGTNSPRSSGARQAGRGARPNERQRRVLSPRVDRSASDRWGGQG
jgi:hypothetical protein